MTSTDSMLANGLSELSSDTKSDIRWDYYEGANERPFAPQGVNTEYEALRRMSALPLIRLAVRTPCQRLRVGGIRMDSLGSNDAESWRIFGANRLNSQQRTFYVHGLVYGYGIASVWPNVADPSTPHIRVEDPQKVYLHHDVANPMFIDYAVKVYTERESSPEDDGLEVAYVYTADTVYRYEAAYGSDDFTLVKTMANPLKKVPFVEFCPERDANGETTSMVDALVPQQRAIDTMRFDLLLAAQFAAFRQRVIVGYDPVARDADGNIVFKRDADGELVVDSNNNPIPVVNSPGKPGVDRLMVFPGSETKVFDLAESDLTNYVTALDMLVASFASTAQVPPQYLVGDFKNVSGDLMVATEATLRSFVSDLQTTYNDAWAEVFELVNVARGSDLPPVATQVVWTDAEPKSLTQVASAASQMVPNGAPMRMFLEMLPGSTQADVDRWMNMSNDALNRALGADLAADVGPKVDGSNVVGE